MAQQTQQNSTKVNERIKIYSLTVNKHNLICHYFDEIKNTQKKLYQILLSVSHTSNKMILSIDCLTPSRKLIVLNNEI